MDALHILISLLVLVILFILLFNYLFYHYYVDKTETYSLATFTVTISMSIGLLCVLLIPIDILLITDKEHSINSFIDRTYLQNIFYSLYGTLIFLSFVLIPFSYFYGDERIEDIRAVENDFREKVCNSVKYTLIFVVICLFLMVCGVYVKQVDFQKTDFKDLHWVKDLMMKENMLVQAVSFNISIFSIIGMFLLVIYTGHGLAVLPFYLIRGTKSLTAAHKEFELDKSQIRAKIRELQERQNRKGNLSQRERKELNKLREDEFNLDKKITKISGHLESENVLNKFLNLLTPFRVVIGVVFLFLSVLIFISLVLTSIDRLLHSKCGLNCGFVIEENKLPNYTDTILMYLSKFLHLDHIFFTIVNIYVFICSTFGMVNMGVKLVCLTLFDVKKESTMPQGLLVMSFMISIMILAFMMEMLTLAPQYSTFGTQTFQTGGKTFECNLSSITLQEGKKCLMSNISQFYNQISLSLPFFSTIFYFANWLLILMLFSSLIYAAFIQEDDIMSNLITDNDDEEKDILRPREF